MVPKMHGIEDVRRGAMKRYARFVGTVLLLSVILMAAGATWSARPSAPPQSATIPILMYHHLDEVGNDATIVTPERFEEHMQALSRAGYTAILPRDLRAFVEKGTPLPDRAVLITFDDGYLSNYEIAWPILEHYGLRAAIFVIGRSVGTDRYKDTGREITPHFTWTQAAEMVASGHIEIQSHTFDRHQWAPFEPAGQARESLLRLPSESEAAYRAAIIEDCHTIRTAIETGAGETDVYAVAYPRGLYDAASTELLQENGFVMSFTTEPGNAVLVEGRPETLWDLPRWTVHEGISGAALLSWLP